MNIGSLFSGIGGIDLAFKQAGFKIIWANEIDKHVLLDASNKDSMKGYIQGYVELKNTIISHGNFIFERAKQFRLDINKEKVKEIKQNVKNAEKSLNIFKKTYRLK